DTGAGDYLSTDVRKGYQGWGPIFNLSGGQTRCPYEGTDSTIFYTDSLTHKHFALNQGTLQTEKVLVKVDGNLHFSEKDNVPSNGQAVYDLEIDNNTESVPALTVSYAIAVPAGKNPNGAVLSIDGYNPSAQLYPVPGGGSIHKTLILQKGPLEFNYDSIAVVVYSACNDVVVADTVYVTAHFLPACTDVAVTYPLNMWVVNNSFHDTLNTVLAGYDINYHGLKEITFEYKPSKAATWIPLKTWYKDSTGVKAIPTNQSYVNYAWGLTQLQDDHYDMRLTSTCSLKVGALMEVVMNQSPVVSGVVDRINPAPFGTPSPGTGILNPGDDISIQFNKPLDGGALSDYNFDIRGVLNGAPVAHSTSLYFDGTTAYAEVDGGATIQKRNFTFEFWAKRSALGEEAVISRGPDATQSLFIGFNPSNQLAVRFGSTEVAGDKSAAIDTANWHHYSVSYTDSTQTVFLYSDFYGSGTTPLNSITNMPVYYTATGKLYFGKETATNAKFFKGNLQEIQLWNIARNSADIASTQNTVLSTNTGNLLYDWRMDEASGTTAADAIRSRNATLVNTNWQITPHGYACAFNGTSGLVELATSKVAISPEMDFTLEFWFKSNQAGIATLFSNGKGDGLGSDSLYAWSIQKDASGFIHVMHDKQDFVATNTNYFDNTWHHFALVLQRSSTLSAYIDGNPQNSVASGAFKQMGGAHMFLGARGYMVGSTLTEDLYYQGALDEVRLWDMARLIKQIQRDKQNRMLGNEAGLQLYLPFESYTIVLGIPVMTASIMDFSNDSLVTSNTAGATTTSNTPTLKLPRPIQAVSFTYSLNTDKIIMTSTMSPAEIENVTLDITVQKVHDLDGNSMQSPKTWIAYINQNQVKWQSQGTTLSKLLNAPLTFTATIVNSGGALKAYTIGNMPSWLSVDAPSGNIAPNSTQLVTFTIAPEVNIGDYTEDITLTTDFNFPEKFTLALHVYAQPPSWSVNPSNYQYSEGVVGQVRIDGITSTNPYDMLAAFSGGVCRGVTSLQYYPAYDKYYAVMDIYSNNNTGDSITFQVWNAAEGKIHSQIIPSLLIFSADSVRGTYIHPQFFDASDNLTRILPLNTGWNWVSVNVLCPDSTNMTHFLRSLHPHTGDEFKGQTTFVNYSTANGWAGSLAAPNAGVKVQPSYKIHVSAADTLVFAGTQVNPTLIPITLTQGWNWTGFVSLRNLTVQEALANLTPTAGDIIKGQTSFALYDSTLGWAGSLNYLQPNQGYMIKSAHGGTYTYPITGINGKSQTRPLVTPATTWTVPAGNYTNNMNVVAKLSCGGTLNNKLTLGAFVNGTCRGAVPVSSAPGTEGVFYLTVFSENASEQMTLKLMDENTGTVYELDNSLNFEVNGVQGNLKTPVQLSLRNAALSSVCKSTAPVVAGGSETTLMAEPVPFTDAFTLNMNIAYGGPVNIKITSVTGQLLYENNFQALSGINTRELSGEKLQMAQGLYIVEMTTSHERIVTRLIKK
ncbi:MAG TPA: LamG-like jellyroll fold domain-containing protein, partial [Bacteroidia bacterium]|nr:LamG-like jellyroll fold domain-containing protein [Bacteroidia bacterium]